jgi:hypothetical protein
LFASKENATDLSNNVYNDSKTVYTMGTYGKNNNMLYTYDNEDDTFANGSFNLDNETLQDTKDVLKFTLKAPSQSSINLNNNLLYNLPLFGFTFNDNGTIKEVKAVKTKPYIFNISKQQGILIFKDNYTYNGTYPIINFTI